MQREWERGESTGHRQQLLRRKQSQEGRMNRRKLQRRQKRQGRPEWQRHKRDEHQMQDHGSDKGSHRIM